MSGDRGATNRDRGEPSPPHLIVFSRAPVPGNTKTRLIPALGAENASRLHAACLTRVIGVAQEWRELRIARRRPPPTLHLFITPPGSQPAFRSAGVDWSAHWNLHNQRGNTLGERMAEAVHRIRGRAQTSVLLVGSDLPLLAPEHLDAALSALETSDAVFGPTLDGGYYLVGLRGEPRGLFDLSDWGTGSVLKRTLEAARTSGMATALVEALPDVDVPEDLARVLAHPRAAERRDPDPGGALRLIQDLAAALPG